MSADLRLTGVIADTDSVIGMGWRELASRLALVVANGAALAAFGWPLWVTAAPEQARLAAPWLALAILPLVVVVTAALLDSSLTSATTLAMLGALTAVGAAVRILGTGVGGVELVFVVLLLAGRVFGARFGFLLGLCVIALSSIASGFGPWTPFQMVACGWVGAGAGLLPGRPGRATARSARHRRLEIGLLCGYGVVASYLFGAVMNLWFWPFAVGGGTSISYAPSQGLAHNLGSFALYTLTTSTLTFDTVRAVTTVVALVAVGQPALAALRRTPIARGR